MSLVQRQRRCDDRKYRAETVQQRVDGGWRNEAAVIQQLELVVLNIFVKFLWVFSEMWIGNHTQAFEWYQFQWPWMTPNQDLLMMCISAVSNDDTITSYSDKQQLRRRVLELSVAKVRTAASMTRSLRSRRWSLLRCVLIRNTVHACRAN